MELELMMDSKPLVVETFRRVEAEAILSQNILTIQMHGSRKMYLNLEQMMTLICRRMMVSRVDFPTRMITMMRMITLLTVRSQTMIPSMARPPKSLRRYLNFLTMCMARRLSLDKLIVSLPLCALMRVAKLFSLSYLKPRPC